MLAGTQALAPSWRWKAGRRTGGGVAAMAEVAYPLIDEEITALAHYLSRL
jgi:hypothetical protein